MESSNSHHVHVGDELHIIKMDDKNGIDLQAQHYSGRTGHVTHIDSAGQLHGTWGGLAVIPGIDKFEILTSKE